MADREKLIELVGQVQDCGCDVSDVVEMNYVENSVLVDHLISHGVTMRERGRWETTEVTEDCETVERFHHFHRECKYSYCDNGLGGHYFCPNCGADMR